MKKWLIILAFALLAAGNIASAVDHFRWDFCKTIPVTGVDGTHHSIRMCASRW